MKKRFIFVQDSGHLGSSFVVCSGYDKKEVLKFIRKNFITEYYEKAKVLIDSYYDSDETKHYVADVYHLDNNPYILRFKRKIEDSWETWETLIHEITHIVDFYSKRGGFDDEPENKAYLMEYLFREIRRKIQGVTKIQ